MKEIIIINENNNILELSYNGNILLFNKIAKKNQLKLIHLENEFEYNEMCYIYNFIKRRNENQSEKSPKNLKKFTGKMEIESSPFKRNDTFNKATLYYNVFTEEYITAEVIDYTRITSHSFLCNETLKKENQLCKEGWCRIAPETGVIIVWHKHKKEIEKISHFKDFQIINMVK